MGVKDWGPSGAGETVNRLSTVCSSSLNVSPHTTPSLVVIDWIVSFFLIVGDLRESIEKKRCFI